MIVCKKCYSGNCKYIREMIVVELKLLLLSNVFLNFLAMAYNRRDGDEETETTLRHEKSR